MDISNKIDTNIELSIVTTMYNSEKFILEFVDRIKDSVDKIVNKYEIILVDDGSKDNSVNIALHLTEIDHNVKLIKFTRNYGHHKAMLCGLKNSIGQRIFLIDIDLEEAPELIFNFYEAMNKKNDDLIYGVQVKRNKDKVLGNFFWFLLKKLSGINLSENVCTVRLMNREFVNRLKLFEQKDYFLGELSHYIGLKQSTIKINKSYKGYSSYNLYKKFSMLFNMIFTNTSSLWIRLSFIAILLSIITFFLFLVLIISYTLGKEYLNGWLSIMLIISFFASINFFFFGLLLQLTSKLLEEVRSKPSYIIEKKINF